MAEKVDTNVNDIEQHLNVDYNDIPERYDIPIVQDTNDVKNSVTSSQDEKTIIKDNNQYGTSPKPMDENQKNPSQQTKYPTATDGSGKTSEACVPVTFYPQSQREPQYPSPIFLQPQYNSLSPNNYQQLSPQYTNARDESSIKLEYRYPPLQPSTQEYPQVPVQGYPQQSVQGYSQPPMQGYFNLGQPSALYLCSYVKPAYPINTGLDNQRQYNNQEENFDKIKDRAEAYTPSNFVIGSNKSISGIRGGCKDVCRDYSGCINPGKRCDGTVDCRDASDEIGCSCKTRINAKKLCDGYLDCPLGEDESTCSGCPSDSFNCQDWLNEDNIGKCIPLSFRCDGKEDCSNGRDEADCTVLTEFFINNKQFDVGFTEGYLFRNLAGKWYPACEATVDWVKDVCHSETGSSLEENPVVRIDPLPIGNQIITYLSETSSGKKSFESNCRGSVYVKCPPVSCGIRVSNYPESYRYSRIYLDNLVASKHNNSVDNSTVQENKSNETDVNDIEPVLAGPRLVGGRASEPKAWPFIVTIYRNGHFSCGGVIVNESWILTAAHCVKDYYYNYYEIHAGMLRKRSFSPMVQVRVASKIIVYPGFKESVLTGDLAMIKLNIPLRFNRWVREACLPSSNSTDEPKIETMCTAIGWGMIAENGPDADQLREVEIPIQECKETTAKNSKEICAGVQEGGKDSCQGDSGGPLMCKVLNSQSQWYVAGIVSHGEGCARPDEPGVYSRVSKARNWIDSMIDGKSTGSSGRVPKQICPGFQCPGSQGKCLSLNRKCDKVVDCLDAVDEIDCTKNTIKHREFNNTNQISKNNSTISDGERQTSSDLQQGESLGSTSNSTTSHDTENLNVETTTFSSNSFNSSSSSFNSSSHSFNSSSNSFNSSSNETSSSFNSPTQANASSNTTDLTNEELTNSTIDEIKLPDEPKRFSCIRFMQSIPLEYKCDGFVDCEDASDEENCTCKDKLHNWYPSALCDGYIDCPDKSDEEDCNYCKENEFKCSKSDKCISLDKKCNMIDDCPLGEDELDCYTLTNGKYINIDHDQRPQFNTEGVITSFNKGSWIPSCYNLNETEIIETADITCLYLGLKSHEDFKIINVLNSTLDQRQWPFKNNTYDKLNTSETLKDINELNTCQGLWIKCKPILSSNLKVHEIKNPNTNESEYILPWEGVIFVDGINTCPAILLQDDWLLTSCRCTDDIDLHENVVMIVLGFSPTRNTFNGPYQQISRVDAVKPIKKLDISMLHIDNSVNFTRYVQPVFAKKSIFPASENDVCIATGTNKYLETKNVFLQPIIDECATCHRCYKNATIENCNDNKNWSGTVVCRGDDGWYPAAIFHKKDINCDFTNTQTLTSIDYINAYLTKTIEDTFNKTDIPICDGVRCALGQCISWENVCDGHDDCIEASDEHAKYCIEKKKLCETSGGIDCKCSPSELRCGNGKCINKEFYCDSINDCPDGTDEPENCDCASYLKLTSPEKICDGIRHCYDKSDEYNCTCKDTSFSCSSNSSEIQSFGHCVSQSFVCDGDADCHNNEDERNCRDIRGTLDDPKGTGEVIERKLGFWQTKCYLNELTNDNATDICKSFNYNDGILLDTENTTKYGNGSIYKLDDFYLIRFKDTSRINFMAMTNGKFEHNYTPSKDCHRAFVKCF
ncbi:serine protease nudel [Aphidius gifuensis]|uniref:serine protease nudel n=1 Tax=Aphidius gifuensis TaxID=684658 RepID=UPI001CDBCB55|nr:serine protease nudel [Aphidius gifuensis]